MKKQENNSRWEIALYQTEDGSIDLAVRIEKETIWLNLNQMVELFQRDKSVISRHLRNVYKEGELDRQATVAKYATTAADGKTYQLPCSSGSLNEMVPSTIRTAGA